MAVMQEPVGVSEAAVERPTGPAAAVMIAAGLGSLVLGLLTTLSEASVAVHDFLELSGAVGPLSGKTIISAGTFFASWAALAVVWQRADFPLRRVALITTLLVALGLLGTFPIFFQAFASES